MPHAFGAGRCNRQAGSSLYQSANTIRSEETNGMRRTRIGSLITAGVLSAVLIPGTTLGIMGGAGPSSIGANAPAMPAGPAAWTEPAPRSGFGLAAAKRATTSARHRLALLLREGTVDLVPEPGASWAAADAPVAVDATVRPTPGIRLGCAVVAEPVVATDLMSTTELRAPAVACKWAVVNAARIRAYQLWRVAGLPDGGPRQLIATIPAGRPLHHIDLGVSRGHVYTYAVVAIGRDGSKLAVSKPSTVRIPPAPDALRMACALASVGDRRGVACKWSESVNPGAAAYVLWRSVDGGPREAIFKAAPGGRLAFLDTSVKPGQTIRYAVVVLDRSGARVGHGGPVTVRIPALHSQP